MRAGWLVLVLLACSSDKTPTSTSTTPKQVACITGTLAAGAPQMGDLDSAGTCRRADPYFVGDSVRTALYGLHVQAGSGYLVTMTPSTTLTPRLVLVAPGDTVRAMSKILGPVETPPLNGPQILFASGVTEIDTVWATTQDTISSDTGTYTATVQSCKVPVPPIVQPTDSITHTDTIRASDCVIQMSQFLADSDPTEVSVHLYAVHFTGSAYREVTFTASGMVWVFAGGPHDDTFASLSGDGYIEAPDSTGDLDYFPWGGRSTDFTLVVAAPAGTSYTLTIGAQTASQGLSRHRYALVSGPHQNRIAHANAIR